MGNFECLKAIDINCEYIDGMTNGELSIHFACEF